jgi:hypothetical protein
MVAMTAAEIVSNSIAGMALLVAISALLWTVTSERRAAGRAQNGVDQHWRRTEAALSELNKRPVDLGLRKPARRTVRQAVARPFRIAWCAVWYDSRSPGFWVRHKVIHLSWRLFG